MSARAPLPLVAHLLTVVLTLAVGGCSPGGTASGPAAESGDGSGTTAPSGDAGGTTSGTGGETEPEDEPLRITHAFGPVTMQPFEDNATRCASWTLDNALPLYAQAVILSSEGGFHHSNWFIVPETEFPGPDGYWNCDDRNFDEFAASRSGTVLFAQSTQSYTEEQRLSQGAVIKIPPRYKVVGGLHTLNASPRETESRLWLSLEPIHPREVDAIVSPMSMQYKDLRIAPGVESRFTTTCDFEFVHDLIIQKPLDLTIHYLLPHYHYFGNYFEVKVVGGELDGETIYTLDGFNGEPNGVTFDPPLHLPGATGIEFTCGYNNWTNSELRWGDGEGEMCVMLALMEAEAVYGGTVEFGSIIVGASEGMREFRGPCVGIAVPKSPDQAMPTEQETLAPLYLPPVQPGDHDIPAVPNCIDTAPDAGPDQPVSFASIRDTVFTPSCSFSSCHGTAAAAGLDLSGADAYAQLMSHTVKANVDDPLITPGDPSNSHLYRLLSQCEPMDDQGQPLTHMPRNSPILLDPPLVAKIRAWIEAGAPND